MKRIIWTVVVLGLPLGSLGGLSYGDSSGPALPYPIVDTGQERCFDAKREASYPKAGEAFFGQDAQYTGNAPQYKDVGDGTVRDLVTGLVWQKTAGEKVTWASAVAGAKRCRTGGHEDWRLPTIKELYSLILFSGLDVDPRSAARSDNKPFIDDTVFDFSYGDEAKGERIIDSQWTTSTKYVHTTMGRMETVFGVNFADGRIKGYGLGAPHGRGEKLFYVRYVRDNPKYGRNDFVDNQDGTITDRATGLIWMKQDSGHLKAGGSKDGGMNWVEALAWAEGLEYAGHSDWRLPNAKELQSIVDYARSPDTTQSAAIDPVFEVTSIQNEAGQKDYPFYWTGTTHASRRSGGAGAYVAFGRSPGFMQPRGSRQRSGRGQGRAPGRRPGRGNRGGGGDAPGASTDETTQGTWMDVHGAGSQRSDPKDGDPAMFPQGRGPQGDAIRIYNHVRCVRGGVATTRTEGPTLRTVTEPAAEPEREAGPEGDPGMGPGRGPGQGPPPGGQGRGGFVKRLDKDGDGKVSKDEFDGPPQHFSEFDRNGDGFIEEDEAPTGPPPGGGAPRR